MKNIIVSLLLTGSVFVANGQDSWTLNRCIDHAIEHNINIKQQALDTEYKSNNLDQAKYNRLPNVNASVSQDLSFGRSQTVSGTYESYNSANTGIGASAGINIWQGGILKKTIEKEGYELQASHQSLEKAKNDISIAVTYGFVDILFAKELQGVAQRQVDLTKSQVAQTKAFVDAGRQAEGTLLEIEAQLASESLELINAKNSVRQKMLTLAQLLELDTYQGFDIIEPELPELNAALSFDQAQVYFDQAVDVRPEIKSAEYSLKSSEMQLAIAKANRLPSLTASASFYDQYFTSNQTGGNFDNFLTQLGDNHRESIGLTLSIPIFNKFQNRTNIANSYLQIQSQKLELQDRKKTLKKEIEQAQIDAMAAQARFDASKKAVSSLTESMRYIDERYNSGLVNTIEYSDAKTKLSRAQSEQIQAKYDFIFKTKILDFYIGKPLKL